MNQDWINLSCISDEYERGVEKSIQFEECNANSSGDEVKFRSPCVNFLNGRRFDVNKFREHFLCDVFLRFYTNWT